MCHQCISTEDEEIKLKDPRQQDELFNTGRTLSR